jgi:hypothetical protein
LRPRSGPFDAARAARRTRSARRTAFGDTGTANAAARRAVVAARFRPTNGAAALAHHAAGHCEIRFAASAGSRTRGAGRALARATAAPSRRHGAPAIEVQVASPVLSSAQSTQAGVPRRNRNWAGRLAPRARRTTDGSG